MPKGTDNQKEKGNEKKMGFDSSGPKKRRNEDFQYDPSRLSKTVDNDDDPVSHKYKQDNFKDLKKEDD
ncbi:hypothetical protein [Thalassobacillus pellis]|uniref:hypothetical protein n=1 Tax=Thalassobacillus pellis TaxID=748008 RepID=UPI0019619AD4|nr:hypothetical protein [Thalassobacillus pellis]MBM7551811.1 hypothetical protein [Thalassobacillus pellis]